MGTSMDTRTDEKTRVQVLDEKVQELTRRLGGLEARAPDDRVAIVVFSGDPDRVLMAFVIATRAATTRLVLSAVSSSGTAFRRRQPGYRRVTTVAPQPPASGGASV